MATRDGGGAPVLFDEYALLAQSGLFDARFYLERNPDIAALNIDPLLHYLEQGCRERRDPSAAFDTAHYLGLCETLGETPVNPLSHYLTIGVGRGLTPKLATVPSAGMLYVDIPRIVDGAAEAPVIGGMSVVGWGIAAAGAEAEVLIALDGKRITSARCGLRRPDVAAAHPDWEGALLSGFAVHLPPKALKVGRHQVSVSLSDAGSQRGSVEFSIDVHDISDHRGPAALRRKMLQAEVGFKLNTLAALKWRPTFRVYLCVGAGANDLADSRRTLESLVRQTYTEWQLYLIASRAKVKAARHRALVEELRTEFGAYHERIHTVDGKGIAAQSSRRRRSGSLPGTFLVSRLAPGDELGCDALLEFALASGAERRGGLFYSDERRMDPVEGKPGAFFKPGWSPDLLLATNYLGRAWCADSELLELAGIDEDDIRDFGDYELNLRLTEVANFVGHVPKVLHQRAGRMGESESQPQERRALETALERRRIEAKVEAGCLAGHYRIKRRVGSGRVSILIPTCAANGLIKTCLETFRARTAYRDYEIICIENIPKQRREWKAWLRSNADAVIETREPFNWSRFNNQAAKRATGQYLLFLNDDIEIIEPGWLDALLEQAQRPEVGVVGPLLLYPDRTVQEAGVMLDDAGRGRHAFRHLPENDPGYFGLAMTQRNVIGVTGACLLTRRETFESLGGFEEAHAIINNDLDFCLRARDKDLLNVYTPHSRLVHHELASRSDLDEKYDSAKFNERWLQVIARRDPYFNSNLSRDHEVFTMEREPAEIVHAGHPSFAGESVRRILVVKLDHIGDCITAIPALRRLARLFPKAHIAVLAARGTLGLWKAEPLVREAIEFNFFHARSGAGKIDISTQQLQALKERLRPEKFDLAIDLRKQPDTRHILEFTGANILVGFDYQGRFPWLDVALEWDEDVPLRTKHGHIADDLLALVEAVGTHGSTDRDSIINPPKGDLALPAVQRRRLFSKPLICVHPSAGSSMRQWPLERFAELISLFVNQRRFNIALIGGPDEKTLAQAVLDHVGKPGEVFNLVGALPLTDLPKLLVACELFVGNNSGPQHLAAALGVRTVGIHSGVVDAREWGPLGPRAVAIRRDMSCSPCFIESAKDCPRGLACMTQLTVADVYGICNEILSSARSSSTIGV